MQFYSVRDLNISSREVWQRLSEEGELIITNNGKPTALMIDVTGDDVEETLAAVRQAGAVRAVNRMRMRASRGTTLSNEEIQAEIYATRGALSVKKIVADTDVLVSAD